MSSPDCYACRDIDIYVQVLLKPEVVTLGHASPSTVSNLHLSSLTHSVTSRKERRGATLNATFGESQRVETDWQGKETEAELKT